jgi:unconventional prefoldin RPB5 interactor 1
MAVMAIAQVLLGEGYYAERSAKQAVEILERRSEFLDSKINATKVHIGDLEAEATFVKNIADEAAAGVVEIKEEYTEPTEFSFQQTNPVEDVTPVDGKVFADAEDAKIMARIAELELAEAAAEDDGTGSDDDNDAEVYRPFTPFQRSMLDEDEDEDEDEEGEDEEEEEEDDDEYEDALQRLAQLPSSSSEKRAHVTTELYQPQPNRVPSEEHHVRGAHEIHAAAHRVRFKDELNVERGASLSAQDPLPPHSHSPSTVHLQAFSGTVLERNPGNLSSNQSVAQVSHSSILFI